MRWHSITLLLALRILSCLVHGLLPRPSLQRQWETTKLENTPRHFCAELQKEWLWTSTTTGEVFEKQSLNITLLWDEELGYAAAALLRAILVAAGYDDTVITLHHRRDFTDFNRQSLIVEVTLAAQLHVRLSPSAAAIPICVNDSTLSFFEDEELLHKCEFNAGLQTSRHATVYILYEWQHTCAAEIIKKSVATSCAGLDVMYVKRSHLEQIVHEHNLSFFFLDSDHWKDSPGVRITKLPHCGVTTGHCEFEKIVSLNVNNAFSPTLSRTFAVFSPKLDDLLQVKKLFRQNRSMEEAACEWAQQQSEKFWPWRTAAVVKPALRTVAVLICKVEEQDLNEYLYLTELTKTFNNMNDTTTTIGQIQFQIFCVDCLDIDWLLRMLFNWYSENRLSNIAGLVLTEDMAIGTASLAEKFQLPLLTYDVSSYSEPVVRSATGRLKHLKPAIHRLLSDCGWQRIGVISETTRLSTALSDALHSPAMGLVIREVNVKSPVNEDGVRYALEKLFAAKPRVILVNTCAATATIVLSIAQEFKFTWEMGYTWIVREYNSADEATSAMRPYSVSFWSRGESTEEGSKITSDVHEMGKEGKEKEVKREEDALDIRRKQNVLNTKLFDDKMDLRKKLEARWHGRAWPLHAAPLLDALLTIEEGFKRLGSYQKTWFNIRRDDALKEFWNGIQLENIAGIDKNLSYDKYGVSAPRVFVRQWGGEPRPRLLATWRWGLSNWRNSRNACPAIDSRDDGSSHCIVATGDPFQPICNDAFWVTSIILASLVGVAFIVATIWWTRHALRARDNHIKTEFAKRLLARRERVFAVLAEHLVDRSALELLQELGTGRFGRVHLGILREPGRKGGNIVVAAKALREEATSAEESEFLKEACILAALHHEHIIRFMGVCVVDGPPMLLMEHAFFGDLLRYLQNRRYLAGGATSAETNSNGVGVEEKTYVSAETLTRFGHEAATALAYIAQSSIVHRDVRASNCLVDERRSLKLADFGLARTTGTVDGEYACRRGLFPVLWMAPESLATGVCSAASDVWAFGVLVFELVTLGQRPYGSLPPPSVLRHVLAGGRPQLPWDASAETRALVRACWRRAPETRPTAARLAEWLNTHRRALRPALVTEFVDIDSQVSGNSEHNDYDL